jgi:hypothetical protein
MKDTIDVMIMPTCISGIAVAVSHRVEHGIDQIFWLKRRNGIEIEEAVPTDFNTIVAELTM